MLQRIVSSAVLCGLLLVPAMSRAAESVTDALIKRMQVKVKLHPEDYKALAGLGAAYLQKGRESGDAADYELAKSALGRSLSIVSNDPAAAFAMTQMAVACMAEHRFKDAYEWAQRALSAGSGDPSPWAIAGDALADVGEYSEAADAYSKLNTSFGSEDEQQAIAYQRESRMSYLRFIAGDTPGAIQCMKKALQIGSDLRMPTENIAWSSYQLGELYLQAGDSKSAEGAYGESLRLLPGYYRAMVGLAKVQTTYGNLRKAAELYEKAIAAVPFPEYAAAAGDLYQALGQVDEAHKAYDLVEFIGHLSEINRQIHNRELAIFYAEHSIKLDRAESLARAELDVRQDIYTWDALAWVLYKEGKSDEAYTTSRKALQYGTRDALLLYHGGVIAAEIGKSDEARADLRAALEINPQFHPTHAVEARKTLLQLGAVTSAKARFDRNAQ